MRPASTGERSGPYRVDYQSECCRLRFLFLHTNRIVEYGLCHSGSGQGPGTIAVSALVTSRYVSRDLSEKPLLWDACHVRVTLFPVAS
jgi:hypothetical protein